jgi:hypothetical protein
LVPKQRWSIRILRERGLYYDCTSMKARHRHLQPHAPAAWLLAFGLFAVALHAFAGVGPLRRSASADEFHAPICGSQGLVAAPALPQSGTGSEQTSEQSCSQICAASAPMLPTAAEIAVPPAPTSSTIFFTASSTRPRNPAWVAHPQRGPPLS